MLPRQLDVVVVRRLYYEVLGQGEHLVDLGPSVLLWQLFLFVGHSRFYFLVSGAYLRSQLQAS